MASIGERKPRVYWRSVDEDQDPDDACWAVKLPGSNGRGSLDIGIGSWQNAYRWAVCMVTLERIEQG